jgi:hypothetical protein
MRRQDTQKGAKFVTPGSGPDLSQRTCGGDAARRTPAAVGETGNDDARASLAAEHEAGLEDGEDGKA